jgi:DDE superfamily endonuclease
MRPGAPTRIEQTYRRHGVVATLAGLDVRTGQVTLLVRHRRRHDEFLALLQGLRRRWPRGRLIIVVDNLSIHTHPTVVAWVTAQQGRVQLVFLPLHASWLNQIEL